MACYKIYRNHIAYHSILYPLEVIDIFVSIYSIKEHLK